MNKQRAVIFIHNLCSIERASILKRELSQIKGISNICLSVRESSLSFFFSKANHISTVENHLVFLGFLLVEDF